MRIEKQKSYLLKYNKSWIKIYCISRDEAETLASCRSWPIGNCTITEKDIQKIWCEGEPDRCDLNYYHAKCPCGNSVMLRPSQNEKCCQSCGNILHITNRIEHSEDEVLMAEAWYFGL